MWQGCNGMSFIAPSLFVGVEAYCAFKNGPLENHIYKLAY